MMATIAAIRTSHWQIGKQVCTYSINLIHTTVNGSVIKINALRRPPTRTARDYWRPRTKRDTSTTRRIVSSRQPCATVPRTRRRRRCTLCRSSGRGCPVQNGWGIVEYFGHYSATARSGCLKMRWPSDVRLFYNNSIVTHDVYNPFSKFLLPIMMIIIIVIRATRFVISYGQGYQTFFFTQTCLLFVRDCFLEP